MKPGSVSHEPHRQVLSSLHFSFFTYKMGLTVAPAPRVVGIHDIIRARPPAQLLVWSEWGLSEDREE